MTDRILDGAYVEIASGVSARTGKGFCTITVRDKPDGRAVSIGQLDPHEVRSMALSWLSVAEAAEGDAAVYAQLRRTGLPEDACLHFISDLRATREAMG